MKREDILRYVGSMQQVAYARKITYGEGRAANMKAIQIKSGDLFFVVMEDKALDISELHYKGLQMNFLSKPGLNGRNHFDTHGKEAQRSIMGGLFFTCGFENICAPYMCGDKEYPMHGRIRTTPAEHVCADAIWEEDKYILRVSGEIRESELFGENLVLRRTIETEFGKNEIVITDRIRNESFRPEPLMMMYHFNTGYPFLKNGCRIIVPCKKTTPRDAVSEKHIVNFALMDEPKDNEDEYVYIHEMCEDEDANTFVAVVNDELQIALKISYSRKNMPYFMQWKSTGSGDYALGLEPSNSCVFGRKYHEDKQNLHTLAAQSEETFKLKISITESCESIRQLEKLYEELTEGKYEALGN